MRSENAVALMFSIFYGSVLSWPKPDQRHKLGTQYAKTNPMYWFNAKYRGIYRPVYQYGSIVYSQIEIEKGD